MAYPGSGRAPRCVRNFWVELEVAGHKKEIKTGPIGAKGGFFLKVCIREDGQVSDAYLTVQGTSDGDTNTLEIQLHDGKNSVREMSLEASSNGAKAGTMKSTTTRKKAKVSEIEERPEIMKRDKAFWRIKEDGK
jgi:hypothetical protein